MSIKISMSFSYFYDEFYNLFNDYFNNMTLKVIEKEEDILISDLILFTGGEDISPILYGELNIDSQTRINRDYKDTFNFVSALNSNKKIWGVCRGSQLIHAILGGKLLQNLYHPPFHNLEGKYNFVVNSTHHQGVIKCGKNMKVLASYDDVVEMAVSENNQILTTQFHPEFNTIKSFESIFKEWFNEKLF